MADHSLWREGTCDLVAALAVKHGWCVESRRMAGTGTVYLRFSRSGLVGQDEDGEDMDAYDELTVRVSDHSTCYETEDLSIEHGGGGNTLAQVEAALSLRLGAWTYTPLKSGGRLWDFPERQPLAQPEAHS